VVSGNVSLYNESGGDAIYPTPVIGALGVMEDVTQRTGMAFSSPADLVVLLGTAALAGDPASMAGSEYTDLIHDVVAGNPGINLELEVAVQRACRRLVRSGIARSAHDVSEGGLAVALAESCILGGVGFELSAELPDRWDAALFGEPQSLIAVSVAPDAISRVAEVAAEEGVPFVLLGTVGGNAIKLGKSAPISVKELSDAWYGGIESHLTQGQQAN